MENFLQFFLLQLMHPKFELNLCVLTKFNAFITHSSGRYPNPNGNKLDTNPNRIMDAFNNLGGRKTVKVFPFGFFRTCVIFLVNISIFVSFFMVDYKHVRLLYE